MASVAVKSERGSDPSIADEDMTDIARRILIKCEEAKKNGIGGQMSEVSHCDGDTNQEQSCAFGILDKHPPLQHVVSVTGCGLTFNIEITGLTYVSVDIVEPYITISKGEAVNWLGLLGYKQENMFQIDNETKELVNYSDMNTCTAVSADLQHNRSCNIEVTNPQQELSHGLAHLDNHTAAPDDAGNKYAGNMHIIEVPSTGDTINCEQISKWKSSEYIESDQYMLKKIKLEKEETAASASITSDIIGLGHELDENAGQSGVDIAHIKEEPLFDDDINCKNRTKRKCSDGIGSDENMFKKIILEKDVSEEKIYSGVISQCDEPIIKNESYVCDMPGGVEPMHSSLIVEMENTGEEQNDVTTARNHGNHEEDNTQDNAAITMRTNPQGNERDEMKGKCKCSSTFYFGCNFCRQQRNDLGDQPQSIKGLKCKICKYETDSCTEYVRHQTTHSEDGTLTCDDCGYTTKQTRQFEKHITYTPNKPYNCKVCDHSSACARGLKVHEWTHSLVRPYKCSMCPYAGFKSMGLQNHHMRMHAKQRSHKCALCPYAAFTSTDLKAHMRTHTKVPKQRPYKCTQCVYSASSRAGLESHMLRTHKEHT